MLLIQQVSIRSIFFKVCCDLNSFAGPGFQEDMPDERLDKDDAILTIGVRTNTGLKNLGFSQGFGFSVPIAKLEFLPNYGVDQPGCLIKKTETIKTLTEIWSPCGHSRAYEIFAEAINHDEFVADGCKNFEDTKRRKCEETGVKIAFLGEDMDFNSPEGFYYFKTGGSAPFYKSMAPRLTVGVNLIFAIVMISFVRVFDY